MLHSALFTNTALLAFFFFFICTVKLLDSYFGEYSPKIVMKIKEVIYMNVKTTNAHIYMNIRAQEVSIKHL